MASNPATFDAEAAFAELGEIDWSETAVRIVVGDLVYLYGSRPVQALTHECLVVETGISPQDLIDDRKFWTNTVALEDRQARTWMRLRLLHTFSEGERRLLSLQALVAAGVSRAPQSRERVTLGVARLISSVLGSRDGVGSDDAWAERLPMDPVSVDAFTRDIDAGSFDVPDRLGTAKTRGSAQRAFAERVKKNYGWRCAITGISTPSFLVASHIMPWSVDTSTRLDPANGICLSTMVDRAFDLGYLVINDDLTISVDAARLESDAELLSELRRWDGASLTMPSSGAPRLDYLRRRRSLRPQA